MADVELDLSEASPRPLTDEAAPAADPTGKSVEAVRGLRDDVDGRVRSLRTELATAPS